MQRDVRSVDISTFEEATTLATNEEQVACEVRIDVNVHLTTDRTDVLNTPRAVFVIDRNRGTEAAGEFEDVSYFRRANYKVCAATKCLAVDTSTNLIDCLKEGLIPFRNCTCEVRISCTRNRSACFTVEELTRATRPVQCTGCCALDQIFKDLLINFKSNLLRKDACQLNFSVKVVVSIQILSQFRAPLSLELLSNSGHSYRINLDVDLRDVSVVFQAPS